MKKLKFIECPNCKIQFNKGSLFERDETSFICNKCGYEFAYPTSGTFYKTELIWGLLFIFIVPSSIKLLILALSNHSEEYLTEELFTTAKYLTMTATILIIGFFMSINGLRKLIKNNSLEKQFPNWQIETHNTLQIINEIDTDEEVINQIESNDAEGTQQEDNKDKGSEIGCLGFIIAIVIAFLIILLIVSTEL